MRLFLSGSILCAALLALPVSSPSRAGEADTAKAPFPVPAFRQVDAMEKPPSLKEIGTVRFLADGEFPPFSYRDDQGTLTGFNVALADALCAELKLRCEFVVKPWDEVEAALLDREGDAVLSGTRMTEGALAKMSFTRPFLRTLGRFAVTAGNGALAADPRGLEGKRIGVHGITGREGVWPYLIDTVASSPDLQQRIMQLVTVMGPLDRLGPDTLSHDPKKVIKRAYLPFA